MFKLTKYIKKNDLFFVFHSAKSSLDKWASVEQSLKKLNLEYYKPLNRVTSKVLKNSVFKNFSSVIGGFILFINPSDKSVKLNLKSINKNLKPSFVLISAKF